jgi:hypothetical protein
MSNLLRIKGTQVGLEVVGDEHINPLSPIGEAKLNLDFSTASLNTAIGNVVSKKLLTYIGVQGTISSGANASKIVTAEILAASPSGTPGGSVSVAGIVTTIPNNKVQIRSSANQQPIESAPGESDIYGRLTESGGIYTLSYFYDAAGVETAFTMPADVAIDILFPESVDFADLPFNAIINGVSFVDGLPAEHQHDLADITDLTVSSVELNDLATLAALAASTGAGLIGADNSGFTNLTGATVQALLTEIDGLIGGPAAAINRDGVNVSSQAGQTIISLGESYVPGTLAFYAFGSKQMRTVIGQEAAGQFIETDPAAGTFTVLATTVPGDILAVDYDHIP